MDGKMIEMMANRGESLFTSKMQDLTRKHPEHKDRINLLLELFRNQVSTMELNENKHYYAAARMFKSCEQVILDTSIELTNIYDATVNIYSGIPAQHHIDIKSNTMSQSEVREKLDTNLEIGQHDINLGNINDDGGNIHSGEVIDLIYDIRPEDLKIEGKRKRGLLPANFDSEVDKEEDYPDLEVEQLLEAVASYDKDGNFRLSCPKCDSKQFIVASSNGVCLDCDCEFIIPFTVADFLEDESVSPISVVTNIKGNFKRIGSSEKKNRGLILDIE